MDPGVIRVELEVTAPENGDGIGIKMLSGNYIHIHAESRWERLLGRLKEWKR
jgi:hypothetical protein